MSFYVFAAPREGDWSHLLTDRLGEGAVEWGLLRTLAVEEPALSLQEGSLLEVATLASVQDLQLHLVT